MKTSVPLQQPIGYHAREWVAILFELTKIKVSLLAMLSTACGFLLAAGQWTTEILIPTGGIFFLACGSSAINHCQDCRLDALMERTKDRPIPGGRISPSGVLPLALFSLLTGSSVLFSGGNLIGLTCGFFAVLWYNGVYALLKRVTPFAIIPGALVGAIPPVVGWVSGMGHFSIDPRIFALSFFFFVWQVPHGGLLLLSFGKDYEKAGLPCLTQIFASRKLSRITFLWILGTAVIGTAFSFLGMVKSPVIHGALLAAGLWLVWKTSGILKTEPHWQNPWLYAGVDTHRMQRHKQAWAPVAGADSEGGPFRYAFNVINFYALSVMVLFSLDRLIN